MIILSISDNSFSLHFTDGITKEVPTPEGYCRLMINNIISDLRRGRIKSKTEYDFRKFDERYLKDLKELLSQKTITTSLQKESTTEGVEHETQATGVTDSTTTELFDSSQSEEPTTEGVEHEMQEDSEYFTVEPAPLKQQKLDLAPDETTEEIKYVMEEIKRSNASNGITTENIEYVQDMTRDVTFSSGKVTSRNVPAFPELSSTNATLPQLPNESGIIGTTVAGLSTLSAYIIAPVLLVAAVTVGGCWFLHKKKREDSYDVEKAGVENEVEAPFFEEQNSLLDEVNIEPGTYRSFQLDNI
ncbi:MAG: hypothetical protein LKM43_03760 [Wolbachia endosymbiont of Penenirmus auritus]|nr:hypothetical protein [Wolbachia endosymbiont of Penenirmus auritus]